MKIDDLYKELTEVLKSSYESGVTILEAESLAGRFLYALTQVANEYEILNLDARMRKSGLKGLKASIYLDEATKTDKKPSDVMLGALVDRNSLVQGSQDDLDKAEVVKEKLENYKEVFKEAHIYFRGLSKSRAE